MNFDELNISDDIKNAIGEMGFEKMTPIQESAIPEALGGHDLIGQAQTGSGKTIAFAIPVLERIFIPDKSPQAYRHILRPHLFPGCLLASLHRFRYIQRC